MTTKENYETLKSTIDALSVDFDKFEDKHVKAAGQRARNHLLTAKKLCDTLRKQIIGEMRGLPTKHRINDIEEEIQPEAEKVEEAAQSITDSNPLKEEAEKVEVKEEAEKVEEAEPEVVKPKRTRKANKTKTSEKEKPTVKFDRFKI